jgi:hypothetical protein
VTTGAQTSPQPSLPISSTKGKEIKASEGEFYNHFSSVTHVAVAEKEQQGQQNGYKWLLTQRPSFSHKQQEKKAVSPITTEDALKTVLCAYTYTYIYT